MIASIAQADANPNLNIPIPRGWKFSIPKENQLTIAISKESSPALRLAYGFVAFMKHSDSYDTETGLQLTVVLKPPISYDKEPARGKISVGFRPQLIQN